MPRNEFTDTGVVVRVHTGTTSAETMDDDSTDRENGLIDKQEATDELILSKNPHALEAPSKSSVDDPPTDNTRNAKQILAMTSLEGEGAPTSGESEKKGESSENDAIHVETSKITRRTRSLAMPSLTLGQPIGFAPAVGAHAVSKGDSRQRRRYSTENFNSESLKDSNFIDGSRNSLVVADATRVTSENFKNGRDDTLSGHLVIQEADETQPPRRRYSATFVITDTISEGTIGGQNSADVVVQQPTVQLESSATVVHSDSIKQAKRRKRLFKAKAKLVSVLLSWRKKA